MNLIVNYSVRNLHLQWGSGIMQVSLIT